MTSSTEQIDPNLELQIKVSKLLSVGFAFSLVWLAGIGSLIALICGFRALKLIKQSQNQLIGKGMAWWCIVAGGVGAVVLPYYLITGMVN